MISRHWIVAIALLMLTGCAVGPNYKRPPVTVPGTYRGLAADTDPQATASLGDEKWWTVYQDEQLQALVVSKLLVVVNDNTTLPLPLVVIEVMLAGA